MRCSACRVPEVWSVPLPPSRRYQCFGKRLPEVKFCVVFMVAGRVTPRVMQEGHSPAEITPSVPRKTPAAAAMGYGLK